MSHSFTLYVCFMQMGKHINMNTNKSLKTNASRKTMMCIFTCYFSVWWVRSLHLDVESFDIVLHLNIVIFLFRYLFLCLLSFFLLTFATKLLYHICELREFRAKQTKSEKQKQGRWELCLVDAPPHERECPFRAGRRKAHRRADTRLPWDTVSLIQA